MSSKILVSLRIDTTVIDKADTLAINGDRSRNFIINHLLGKKIRNLEKRHGEVAINYKELEKFRRKRRGRSAASSPKKKTGRIK